MIASPSRLAIGALARSTGCSVETIRYYERIGVLSEPERSPGGYRLYGQRHVKRLAFVRQARGLGFTLDQVRALLRLAGERVRPCAAVRDVALAHLADVRGRIGQLRAMENSLKELVTACADGSRPDCPLIEALGAGAPTAP